MNNNEIVFSDSKKVVDIKSMSTEELYEARIKARKELEKIRDKGYKHSENTSYLILAGVCISLLSVIRLISHSDDIDPNGLTTVAILDGLFIAFPTLGKIIGNRSYDEKYKTQYENVKMLDKEYEEKIKHEVVDRKVEDAYKKIDELQTQLSKEYELDNFEQYTRDDYEKRLVEKGVDKKIIKMPGIQKLFDAVLFPTNPDYGHRLYSSKTIVDNEGTFIIEAYIKDRIGVPEYRNTQSFEVSYGKDNNPEHYLRAKDENGFIVYINKDGNISSIDKMCSFKDVDKRISVPFEKQIEKTI